MEMVDEHTDDDYVSPAQVVKRLSLAEVLSCLAHFGFDLRDEEDVCAAMQELGYKGSDADEGLRLLLTSVIAARSPADYLLWALENSKGQGSIDVTEGLSTKGVTERLRQLGITDAQLEAGLANLEALTRRN